MKKIFLFTAFILGIVLLPRFSFAQGMMNLPSSSPNTAAIQAQQREEQEGKQFLDNLNNKTVSCDRLKNEDFEKIGEYIMGRSIGDTSSHIAMNEMMKRMMGEQGEEQMHMILGKRGSGCDVSAAFPSQTRGFLPMMGMMGNYSGGSMMGYGGFGFIPMILWWMLLVAGIILLVLWLTGRFRPGSGSREKTALDILEDRYAKGEIDKKEFEEKKRDLSSH